VDALRIDSTNTPDAIALVAAAPRVEWLKKHSVSTPAAFSSFLIHADMVKHWTCDCPTETIIKC
jgi:hypothetical protein